LTLTLSLSLYFQACFRGSLDIGIRDDLTRGQSLDSDLNSTEKEIQRECKGLDAIFKASGSQKHNESAGQISLDRT
jgi:hypothetical protein